ncbi:Hypothetical predicted protein [Pelobates cultripes]|uniref:Uncharacterized protein n=1 Tax=Pelobates cultripes TaxID=61616 RepID=A0AAD1SS91_PELCU|nr:Hypothetical predicted protein [Pelobates cultripes]
MRVKRPITCPTRRCNKRDLPLASLPPPPLDWGRYPGPHEGLSLSSIKQGANSGPTWHNQHGHCPSDSATSIRPDNTGLAHHIQPEI